MENKIFVSVIIPIFNVEKYLEKCIQSVIKQSYKDLEIILINDGSTDKSYEICQKYDSVDDRIILINQNNGGVSRARNKGLEKASGDYIMFVDSDDELSHDAVERLLNIVISNNADIAICGYKELYKDKVVSIQCPEGSYIKSEIIKKFVMSNLNKAVASSLWAKIYRKEVTNHYFQCEISMGEDLLYNLKAFSKCNRIELINENLYYYNMMNDNSLVSNYRLEYYDQITSVYLYAKQWVKNDKKIKLDTLNYMMSNSFLKYLLALSESKVTNKCGLLQERIDNNIIEAIHDSKNKFNLLQRWVLSSIKSNVVLLIVKAKAYNILKMLYMKLKKV